MKKVIYKYEIFPDDIVTLDLPFGAEILTVQTQKDKVCLWALVSPDLSVVKRYFRLAGTGHEIDYSNSNIKHEYINTFQLSNGNLVFHLFEIINRKKLI